MKRKASQLIRGELSVRSVLQQEAEKLLGSIDSDEYEDPSFRSKMQKRLKGDAFLIQTQSTNAPDYWKGFFKLN